MLLDTLTALQIFIPHSFLCSFPPMFLVRGCQRVGELLIHVPPQPPSLRRTVQMLWLLGVTYALLHQGAELSTVWGAPILRHFQVLRIGDKASSVAVFGSSLERDFIQSKLSQRLVLFEK